MIESDSKEEDKSSRTISEIQEFTRDDIEKVLKYVAKSHIVGDIYIGEFHNQRVHWIKGGGAIVTTVHQPRRRSRAVKTVKSRSID